MRSLALWKVLHASLTEAEFSSSSQPDARITAVAHDLDQDELLLGTEAQVEDGELTVEVWKMANGDTLVGHR